MIDDPDFTPGPWVVNEWSDLISQAQGDGKTIVFSDDMTKADARLISVAPELLEVTKLAHAMLTGAFNEHPHVLMSRLALVIAKAEGR